MGTSYSPAAAQWVICHLLKANCQMPWARGGEGGGEVQLIWNGQSQKYVLYFDLSSTDNVRYQSLYYVNDVLRHQHDKNREQLFRPYWDSLALCSENMARQPKNQHTTIAKLNWVALSVLVMLVSGNVYRVVSALRTIVCLHWYFLLASHSEAAHYFVQ